MTGVVRAGGLADHNGAYLADCGLGVLGANPGANGFMRRGAVASAGWASSSACSLPSVDHTAADADADSGSGVRATPGQGRVARTKADTTVPSAALAASRSMPAAARNSRASSKR